MKFSLIASLSLIASATADVVSLTEDNYATETDGKVVFIKFFAPWCGHCKSMAKDWETLAAEYEGSNILIAEADCTIEDDDLCDDNGVEGFPTLKYGDPNALEDYDGGRDLPALQSFAKASLKPSCSPTNLDLCDAEQKAEIEKVSALSKDELIAKIKDVKDTLKKLDDEQEKIVEGLQNQYEKISEETDKAKKAAKKDSNFKLMKSVLASKSSDSGNEEL